MREPLPTNEIRLLVRQLLRKTPPERAAPHSPEAPGETVSFSDRVRGALKSGQGITVAVANDQELNSFAQAIALCALERDVLGVIASNRVRFKLTTGDSAAARPRKAPAPASDPQPIPESAFHWDRGLLSEAKVEEIGKTHSILVLGPRAVMTPLAKDKIRECKLELVRQKR